MKKICKAITLLSLLILGLLTLVGCDEEMDGYRKSDKISRKISQTADKFQVQREIKVYNIRTNDVIYETRGFISVEDNTNMKRLEVVTSIGDDVYKKDMIGLNENITYVVTDLDNTTIDNY